MNVSDPIKRKFIFVVFSVIVALLFLVGLEVLSSIKKRQYESKIYNYNSLRNLLAVCLTKSKEAQTLSYELLADKTNRAKLDKLCELAKQIEQSAEVILSGGTYSEKKLLAAKNRDLVTLSFTYDPAFISGLESSVDALYFSSLKMSGVITSVFGGNKQLETAEGSNLQSFLLLRDIEQSVRDIEAFHDKVLIYSSQKLEVLREQNRKNYRIVNMIRYIAIGSIAVFVILIVVISLFQIEKILASSQNYMARIDDANMLINELFESLPVGILLLDADGNIKKYNSIALRMLANGDRDLLLNESLYMRNRSGSTQDGEFTEAEVVPVFSNGEYTHFLFKSRFFDLKGDTIRLDAFVDITKRKKFESRLKFRNTVYQSVNVFSQMLLTKGLIDSTVLHSVLETISHQLSIAVVELFCVRECPVSDIFPHSLVRWENKSDGLAIEKEKPVLQHDKFPRLMLEVSKRGYVFGLASELPQNEQQTLNNLGIHNYAVFPIVLKGVTVAFFGLYGTEENRQWLPDDISGINFFTDSFSAIIERYVLEKELATNNAKLKSYSEELAEQSQNLMQKNEYLIVQQKEIEKANSLKSEFLANISHELRTPMNAVIGISKMLGKYNADNLTEKQQEGLQIIHQSAHGLLELINDILDMSKAEAGKMEINATWFNVEATMETIRSLVNNLADEKGLELHFEYQDLPEKIFADQKKYHQIVMNIVGNAVKFTDSGGVKVLLQYNAGNLETSVEDTGIGIPEQDLPSIFDHFKQLDGSAARSHKGTGLGLSLCKKLTELMGGDIFVESKVGKGTLMKVQLPVKTEKERGDVENRSGMLSKQLPENLKILIIEDDENNIFLYREYLTDQPVQLMQVKTGNAGLDAVQNFNPDIVILDINLPDISGLDVIRSIRQSESSNRLPVVVSSAVDYEQEMNDYGAAAYIKKPVSLDAFLSTIIKVVKDTG